ncbi:DUF4105 domain-containing protein [Treponema primitia]|uniref:lipoprotein N-acyltransferase Lnb domain-containing protein n=1 Tax=Treponema primitia TaxID=88058 RepID=UPI003980D14B
MKGPRILSFLFFLLLVRVLPLPAEYQWPEPDKDDLTIRISVMGPGDELYFWWGHIALIIEDRASRVKKLYDYGLFSFENDNFFVNFAFGRLLYSCGVSRAENNIAGYILSNRDVTFYTLDLPRETKEKVRQFAEENVRPENKDYWYHHFRDNCATRIRDIVDLATDGQFSEAFLNAPGRFTLREQVQRHTWFNPFMDWFLSYAMGQDIDVPTTVWQEMFLPSEIGARITDFRYIDNRGQERNLVKSVDVINVSENRPLPLDIPRKQWPRELLLSLCIAAFLGLLMAYREKVEIRVALGLSQSILGLIFGISGTIAFFMSFFTNHDYTYHNMNLLFINPLLLAAVPLGLLYAFPRDIFRGRFWGFLLKALWSYVVIAAIFSMVLRILPRFWQQSQVSLALVLPFAAVLSLAPDRILRFKRQYLWRQHH